MLTLQTKTKQKIGEKEYDIEFPKVGELLEIENLKLLLSGNTYGTLVQSRHNTAIEMLNLIDGVAYFTVLAKGFKEDYKIEDFTNIDILKQKEIIFAFIEFWKWYKGVENEANKIFHKEDLEDKKEA